MGVDGETIDLADNATVYRAQVGAPGEIVRHYRIEGSTFGVSGPTSDSTVTIGHRVEDRAAEIAALLPVRVTFEPIYKQHRVGDSADREFPVSLSLSVGVVIGVLALFLGWRAAFVVGGLLLTLTFLFMALFDIKVERISLGALIIAKGTQGDNAILVAEGMQAQLRMGCEAAEAADEVSWRIQIPFLGATVIGVVAFAGIGLSSHGFGEFLFSLFAVLFIALSLSWLTSVTVTPLLASYVLKVEERGARPDPYVTPFLRAFVSVVRLVLKLRWLVLASLLGGPLLVSGCSKWWRNCFFRPPIRRCSISTKRLDREPGSTRLWLTARDDVIEYTTNVGQSLTRFLLTYTPEDPNPSYGQIVIRASAYEAIPAVRDDLAVFAQRALPWAESRVEQIIYDPPVSADVEVRLSGPDPDVLRALADEAEAIFRNETALLQTERFDWREPCASWIGRSRLSSEIHGRKSRPLPPVLDQVIQSPVTAHSTSLKDVIDGFEVIPRDTLMLRRERMPTIIVQGFAVPGVLLLQAIAEVGSAIEVIALSPGHSREWGSEQESAGNAMASLGKQMPSSIGITLLITLLLIGKRRRAAATTILEMAPLLFDVVFASIVVTIMSGLGFASVLTLSGISAHYHTYIRKERRAEKLNAKMDSFDAETWTGVRPFTRK